MIDALIFDFDDTLVATNDTYDAKRLELYNLMRSCGLEGEQEWPDFLNDTDISFVHEKGHLAPDCFPRAMRRTVEYFAAAAGVILPPDIPQQAEDIGWSVYTTKPQIIDGAAELLQYLHGKARMFLLTEGYDEIQLPRLHNSGFLPFFDSYHIVKHKNISAYRQLIAEHNIDVSRSWMIGNSVRSDVNPSVSVGLKCAYFTRSDWSFDHEELLGEPHRFAQLCELPEILGL